MQAQDPFKDAAEFCSKLLIKGKGVTPILEKITEENQQRNQTRNPLRPLRVSVHPSREHYKTCRTLLCVLESKITLWESYKFKYFLLMFTNLVFQVI